jgi:DNA-binding protein YbaB
MDEQTARQTLTVAQYERWEKLNDLYDDAEATKEQWEAEAEQVAEITVEADMESLGTAVEVYGNDLVVHIDSDDPALRENIERLEALQDEYADLDADDMTLDDGDELKEEMRGLLQSLLDSVLVEWNGTAWDSLAEDQRADIVAEAAESWGFDALLMGWVDIAQAIQEDREDRMDVIESFRDPARRGDR